MDTVSDAVATLYATLAALSLPIWISIVSLVASLLAFYFQWIRKTTDLRVSLAKVESDDPGAKGYPKITTTLSFHIPSYLVVKP